MNNPKKLMQFYVIDRVSWGNFQALMFYVFKSEQL